MVAPETGNARLPTVERHTGGIHFAAFRAIAAKNLLSVKQSSALLLTTVCSTWPNMSYMT